MARGGGGGGRGGGFRGGRFRGSRSHARGGRHSTISDIIGAVVILFLWMISSCQADGGLHYNSAQIEEYASAQYQQAFMSEESYEDNLLLTFVVWDDRSDYSYIAWVGDHINDTTFRLLGDNNSVLGRTLEQTIAYGYESSLSADLKSALEILSGEITYASPSGCYLCDEDHSAANSRLSNQSEMTLDEDTLEAALEAFTDETGIPIVLVVEDAADVFG